MNFEKPKSSIERVVGAPPELEKKILEDKAELFDNQIFESLKGREREKAEDDLQMIEIANYATNAIRLKYGMEEFDIPAKNFHLIPENEWQKDKSLAGFDGIFNSMMQGVVMRDAKESRIYALSVIIHETLHFKSYTALQISAPEESDPKQSPILRRYRDGLMTRSRDGKDFYFSELNEAITEELSKRLMSGLLDGELRDNPLFAKEISQTETIIKKHPGLIATSGRPLFTSDTLYAEKLEPENFWEMVKSLVGKESLRINTRAHTYKKQRRMLNSLMDKIWNKHQNEFKDQEAVFDVFVRSYMTGNLLPIGRLIEDTFGKGTFRNIAELDMHPKKKEPSKSP